MEKPNALRLNKIDNVAVALDDIPGGGYAVVLGDTGATIEAREAIPFGHKIALVPLEAGMAVVKYGVAVGFTTEPVTRGGWVHTHNVNSYFEARREGRMP